jgi:D-amino-acid oxidase
MTSYRVLSKLAASLPASAHGVRMRLVNFFFRYAIDTDPAALHKMREIAAAGIDAFRRDARLVAEHAVNQRAGIVDSYQHLAPVIDTDAYMVWLQTLVAGRGAVFETRRVSGELLGMEEALLRAYGACAIVNATGLGAKELAGDPTVFPLRGALIRVKNDGKRFPRVTQALCVTHDETRPGEDTIVFVVPRNDDVLILGGVAQRDEWNLDLTLDSPEMKRIRKRCNDFVPGLENAELDPEAPIVQGLRPLTTQNVRVAREPRLVRRDGRLVKSKIVHSYGHGGSGFTLSFGCAADVLGHVRQIVREEQLPGVEEIGIVMARL